jgi:putative hemolysin
MINLLLLGFFSGIESAFSSLNRFSIELKKKQGLASGKIISNFFENQSRFTGALLVAINFTVIFFILLFTHAMDPIWKQAPQVIQNSPLLFLLEALFAIIILLFFQTMFKSLFRTKSNVVFPFFARTIQFFYSIFSPVASVFEQIASWVLKYMFDVKMNDKKEAFIRIDVEHFIQQTKENNDEGQELNTELFENALSLPSIKVRQCLIPRKEIVGVDIKTTLDELKQKFIETKLSKLIVFDGTIDTILGYVHHLDFFRKPPTIQSILLPIPAVPESMGLTNLINLFTKERKSIAWVVDEFGGTSGIVTMEDLLEEIFGEIQDEYDIEEFIEKQLADDEFIFSGRLELDYLSEKYNLEFKEDSDAETLSGYIVQHHETIPVAKERIIIDNYEFDVLTVNETRIETVKMKILH